ncbi:hypothetical protein HDU97_009431, partial [Phlyctochytrium planicorne]
MVAFAFGIIATGCLSIMESKTQVLETPSENASYSEKAYSRNFPTTPSWQKDSRAS